jgi:hypothetical protein
MLHVIVQTEIGIPLSIVIGYPTAVGKTQLVPKVLHLPVHST